MSGARLTAALALGLTVGAPVGAALFKVWVYQDAVQLGYRLSEREEERKRLRNELRQLEVELAAERSPARLSQLARALGLEAPEARQLVVFKARRPPSASQTTVSAGAPRTGGQRGAP